MFKNTFDFKGKPVSEENFQYIFDKLLSYSAKKVVLLKCGPAAKLRLNKYFSKEILHFIGIHLSPDEPLKAHIGDSREMIVKHNIIFIIHIDKYLGDEVKAVYEV